MQRYPLRQGRFGFASCRSVCFFQGGCLFQFLQLPRQSNKRPIRTSWTNSIFHASYSVVFHYVVPYCVKNEKPEDDPPSNFYSEFFLNPVKVDVKKPADGTHRRLTPVSEVRSNAPVAIESGDLITTNSHREDTSNVHFMHNLVFKGYCEKAAGRKEEGKRVAGLGEACIRTQGEVRPKVSHGQGEGNP